MNQAASEEVTQKRSFINVPPALRYPAYRRYWLGTLASVTGFQVNQFAQYWIVYELTKEPYWIGLIASANAVPAIALNLFGGAFADRFDKRRLILTTQSISAVLIFLLATLTVTGWVNQYYVVIIAFFAGAVNAFDQPARQALYPHLIDRKVMMSAVALNSAIWQGTRIVAPAIAGGIIWIFGSASAFFLASFGFAIMVYVLYGLSIPKIERSGTGNPLLDIYEGLKFIINNSIFSFLIGMTFFNSFFGMAYITMMPVFAVDILNIGAKGQGVLMSVSGVGALATTMYLGSLRTFKYKGLMLIGGATLFGLSVFVFAMATFWIRNPYVSMAIMITMGVFNSIYMISVMSSLQMLVPDRMRGRVMGFYSMTWSIMPLGATQAGFMATFFFSPVLRLSSSDATPFAIAFGGLAVAAFALGPALINKNVRNVGMLLLNTEKAAQNPEPAPTPKLQTANAD